MAKREENTHQTQEVRNLEQGAFLVGTSSSTAYNPHLLRYLREKADLSQAELAKKFNTSVETVAEWETGRRVPNQKHLQALEKFFKLPAGGFTVEMKDILNQDFRAAYFGDTDARERLEWADRHLSLGQALRIIPPLPKI
ncbi:MAG: helix-turn-helix transcriptional regulator [Candidatus Poribacteria bacterium]|nr:helix-turn-helix transcriptional regulator [Candidatus Poribacteria bacterium]